MKKSLAATLYGAVAVALIGFSTSAAADFSGPYAPENWTTMPSKTDDPAVFGNGWVDTKLAPTSITVFGSDGSPVDVRAVTSFSFTFLAAGKGTVKFDWSYETIDDPQFDFAGYKLNGIYDPNKQLSVDLGPQLQSGTNVLFDVVAGDTLSFYVESTDSRFGGASLTISNFSAPVPEPGQAAMLALGLLVMGYVGSRKRQQN